ncbi:MAG: oxidoreductase [Candidatus Methanomethylophilaceae archaeon]|nr:oxidoreductase [Candidatus Methanomethylophilaceae archaeon]
MTVIPAPDYSLTRDGLIFDENDNPSVESEILPKDVLKKFGKSVSIREIDSGSCNACECEINCCSNRYYDMSRFGLKIVASPRHADVLLVTGPMTKNMELAAVRTYDAAPFPKLVIAMGTCAISGGLFAEGDVSEGATDSVLKADMYITGCPPSPARIIRSLTSAFGITGRR